MKDFIKVIEENKLILSVSKEIYEKESIINSTYKFTDKCYILIDSSENNYEILFESKDLHANLKEIAMLFSNELIDQQIRINCAKEFKFIQEEIVKKAFKSIS